MKIKVSDKNDFYEQQIFDFISKCQEVGRPVEIEKKVLQEARLEFSSTATEIIIQIDPETLRLIFKYALVLIATYKSTNYFGEAFKAAVQKIGENVGSRLSEILANLWKGLCERIKELHNAKKHTHVYFSLLTDILGTSFEAEAHITPQDFKVLSNNDLHWLREQAANLILYQVIPIAEEFIKQSNIHNRKLDKVTASLYIRKDDFGYPCWEIKIPIIGNFILDPECRLIPQYIGGKVFSQSDIAEIVKGSISSPNP